MMRLVLAAGFTLCTACGPIFIEDRTLGPIAARDDDGDGLSNALEREIGTDPFWVDTDRDGAYDGEEWYDLWTDPLDPDTDGDGLLDGVEAYELFTDPLFPNR